MKSRKTRPLIAIALMLVASAVLAACGGSSSGSTSTTTAASSTTQSKGPGGTRFTALRECLKKEGITLPTRPTGSKGAKGRPPAGGGFTPGSGGAGGFAAHLPKGVSRSKYEAAIKKCGGGNFGRFGGGSRLSSASFKKALTKFAACMRQDGVNVPTPNTSGNGPIFNTKGLNTKSSKFRAAQLKCASLLRTAQPGGGAAPPGGAPGGAPEAPGGAPAPAG